MVHSLGLTLYSLRPRKGGLGQVNRPVRPAGKLVWMHAPTVESLSGLAELCSRMADEDEVSLLITCPVPISIGAGVFVDLPPEDTVDGVREFLDHWRPDIALFSDGELRPALLHEASERAVPLFLVDARTPYLLRGREGWYPGLIKSSILSFNKIMALDEAAARAFRRAGATGAQVRATGRLEEDSAAIPCLEAERAALAKLLATRPVWFAAGLPEAEEAAIIAAHRAALGMSHRLLLIISPQEPERAGPLAKMLSETEGWVVACRVDDEEPEPDVEVFVTDGMAEIGLWYRLAPITFLGGSLGGKGCLRNPMEPAALGSAILYGPRPGEFGNKFGRLGAARAARAVGNARDLADALADLMAADKVARLAQAAWGVASEGAEVTEQVLKTIRKVLEGGKP